MKQAMRKMGIEQEEIDATEVIIKTQDKEFIIREPQVTKVRMMGQESFQVAGAIEERDLESFKPEDVRTVMEQAQVSEEEANRALKAAEGDLAEAIISLKGEGS